MEIVVVIIMGIAILGVLSIWVFTGLMLARVVKLLRVAASTPPQPRRSGDRRRRQEPQQEESQESAAAGAIRRRQHAKGEA